MNVRVMTNFSDVLSAAFGSLLCALRVSLTALRPLRIAGRRVGGPGLLTAFATEGAARKRVGLLRAGLRSVLSGRRTGRWIHAAGAATTGAAAGVILPLALLDPHFAVDRGPASLCRLFQILIDADRFRHNGIDALVG